MVNKAHTAVLRRIAKRYQGTVGHDGMPDIQAGDISIEVETAATLPEGIARLLPRLGRRYVAVTNREALDEALRLTAGTGLGVMSPQGDIIREAEVSGISDAS
jgi:hypothetical protein